MPPQVQESSRQSVHIRAQTRAQDGGNIPLGLFPHAHVAPVTVFSCAALPQVQWPWARWLHEHLAPFCRRVSSHSIIGPADLFGREGAKTTYRDLVLRRGLLAVAVQRGLLAARAGGLLGADTLAGTAAVAARRGDGGSWGGHFARTKVGQLGWGV